MATALKPDFVLNIRFCDEGYKIHPDWQKQFLDCAKTIIGLGGIVRVSVTLPAGVPPKDIRTLQEFDAIFESQLS